MNFPWFRRTGLFFVPVSIIGWLVLLAGVGVAVWVFQDIDKRSHSASDTLINFVFNLVMIGAAYSLIAFLTSKKSD